MLSRGRASGEAGSASDLLYSFVSDAARCNHRIMSNDETVRCESDGPVTIVTIDRPAARTAVNPPTARALAAAFRQFDAAAAQHVAILTGAAGTFFAGLVPTETAPGQLKPRCQELLGR